MTNSQSLISSIAFDTAFDLYNNNACRNLLEKMYNKAKDSEKRVVKLTNIQPKTLSVNPVAKDALAKTVKLSPVLAKKLGLYDSLILSRMRDVIANAYSLGLTTKYISHVIPKHLNTPVSAQWTKFRLKRVCQLLPFLSSRTVQRHANNLERKGLVYCSALNKSPVDTTCWYSINYQKIRTILNQEEATI